MLNISLTHFTGGIHCHLACVLPIPSLDYVPILPWGAWVLDSNEAGLDDGAVLRGGSDNHTYTC